MKKFILFLFLTFIFSCSTKEKLSQNEYVRGIVYILPVNVQNIFIEDSNNENTYYVLEKISDLKFRIYKDKFEIKDSWIKNSNRYVFLNGKLYPLLFEYDNYFAITESAQIFLENYNNNNFTYTKKSNVRDHVYHVDFNIKGEILYIGY